jgi:hypothetical protein
MSNTNSVESDGPLTQTVVRDSPADEGRAASTPVGTGSAG